MTDKPQTQLDQALDRIDILEDRLAKQDVAIAEMAKGFGIHQNALELHQQSIETTQKNVSGTLDIIEKMVRNPKR